MTRETLKQAIPALLIAALLPGGALADGVGPGTDWPTAGGTVAALGDGATAGASTASSGTAGEAGLLASLSPGDRKIASALYEAQGGGVGKGRIRLDDIARARQEGFSWNEIFKRMKADGLLQEKNVGQVISKHASREVVGEAASAAEADKRSQARSKFLKSLGKPSQQSPVAAARSKLKPTARPGGGTPGRRAILTLAFVR